MHMMSDNSEPHPSFLKRVSDDRSGLALLEFAYGLPLVLFLGLSGIEIANLALSNLRVSQIAIALADNTSRVGERTALATQQLRESDINDVLEAVRQQGSQLDLTNHGRVTISSLEGDALGTQRIHWQRCIGTKAGAGYDSSYGVTSINAGTDQSTGNAGTLSPGGMGPSGQKVVAPPSSGVIFVEINYDYQPIVNFFGGTPRRLSYTASFIVRDNRDFRQLYNPTPVANRATCNKYTA